MQIMQSRIRKTVDNIWFTLALVMIYPAAVIVDKCISHTHSTRNNELLIIGILLATLVVELTMIVTVIWLTVQHFH